MSGGTDLLMSFLNCCVQDSRLRGALSYSQELIQKPIVRVGGIVQQ